MCSLQHLPIRKQVAEKIIELRIDKLAGLGDGAGEYEGSKVFIPYTVAGDFVRARIGKETSDATYATIERILKPGKGRIDPVCRHFTRCGGCMLQHLDNALYFDFKQKMAEEAVRKAGFDMACVKSIVRFPANTRRRVDLKVKNGKIGYHAERSHKIVDLEDCRVLEPELLELVMQIKNRLPALPKITAIKINGVDGGYDVIVDGNDGNNLQVADCPGIKRLSVRNGSVFKAVYQNGEVTLALGGVTVEVPPNAFLQASRAAQTAMTDLVKSAVHPAKNVLDLFAGIGTYAFPVSAHAFVTAIEGDKAMTDAMQKAAEKHGISDRFKVMERDLFYTPLTKDQLAGYDAVIINPPRAGAKAQAERLALSQVAKIVMVSCNPATFTRDARILKESGYKLQSLTPLDQFVYSSHLELVAEFGIL